MIVKSKNCKIFAHKASPATSDVGDVHHNDRKFVPGHSDAEQDVGVPVLSDNKKVRVKRMPDSQRLPEGIFQPIPCPGRVLGSREEGNYYEAAAM